MSTEMKNKAIVTRKEAIEGGLPGYNTGRPCKWGHYSDRDISGGCRECKRIRGRSDWRKHGAEYYERRKGWYKRNYLETLSDLDVRSARLLSAIKARSRKAGLPTDMTRGWLKGKLFAGTCELSGRGFVLEGSSKYRVHPFSPSVDRIDSSRGYTEENCRMVLSCINIAINEWGYDLYMQIAEECRRRNTVG